MTKPLKIIFAGTPDFAVPALKALHQSEHEIVLVMSQPDKPKGRGRKVIETPVKQYARENALPTLQPTTLKCEETQSIINALAPDVMIVVAYGMLLPKALLSIPRLGCLNIHASLLPRWRGAAPIQRALLAGDQKTGVGIMQMELGLDTGPVFAEKEIVIEDTITGSELTAALSQMGAQLLIPTLEKVAAGELAAKTQATHGVTYAKKVTKTDLWLDFSKSATCLARQVRTFDSKPVCQTMLGETLVKVWQAQALPESCSAAVGTIVAASADGIKVACGEGSLQLTQCQLPGGKALSVDALLRGHSTLFAEGTRFSHEP